MPCAARFSPLKSEARACPRAARMNQEAYRHLIAGETATFVLSPRALWRLTGPDAERYLNGQITNDVTRLADGDGCYAAVCTAKGRMEGELFVARRGTDFYLDAPFELRESLGARLQKYLIADDAIFEDVGDLWSLSHVFGTKTPDVPKIGFVIPRPRFGLPGHDVWMPASGAAVVGESTGAAVVETLRLENGIPAWGAELTTNTLPPEAGPHLIAAISYTKGCYVGQETIARLKSVGHVNRTLVFLRSDSDVASRARGQAAARRPRGGHGDQRRFLPAAGARDRAGLCAAHARGGRHRFSGGRFFDDHRTFPFPGGRMKAGAPCRPAAGRAVSRRVHPSPVHQREPRAGAPGRLGLDRCSAPAIDSMKSYPRAKLVALPGQPIPAEKTIPVAPPGAPSATSPSPAISESTPAPADTTAPAAMPDASQSAAQAPPPAADSNSGTTASPPSMPMPADTTSAAPGEVGAATATTIESPDNSEVAVIQTSLGKIIIELDDFAAPKTCKNFRQLIADGFYNNTVFHRVIPNFIIQGGDPKSKSSASDRNTYGLGSPGYTIPSEIALKHDRGAVGMARLPDSVNPQRESNGSQFYICLGPCPSLDDQYTVFGHVIQGLDVAEKIATQPRDARDNPLQRIEMTVNLQPKDQAMANASTANP